MYGPNVLEHFQNPRCTGKILDADGVATVAEGCGDVFRFYVKIRDNRLVEVRYEVKGCPVAIACCSMTATLAEGKTLLEATKITDPHLSVYAQQTAQHPHERALHYHER
jgi:nitrogen fixation NifU-like protein